MKCQEFGQGLEPENRSELPSNGDAPLNESGSYRELANQGGGDGHADIGRRSKSDPPGATVRFENIVGQSGAVSAVLELVSLVAPTNSTALIRGETGTGKELIARAIHNTSPRRGQNFVALNCAAIPAGLLESELFGHERGAFTGAVTQRIGRLELAHKGTLFLDEIGELPQELQPKLLRVLQEQAFERLGGTRTIRSDFRLVAATNRNLEEMVENRKYRSDLFYRLNIFPLRLPPLRDRREDIPALVRYFADRFSHRMHKSIEAIADEFIEKLVQYDWPGNVRELQNIVERAVIFSSNETLELPDLTDFAAKSPAHSDSLEEKLETVEYDLISRSLREANWVIGGPRGAAARLGLKRTGLLYKMQRLGISRPNNGMRIAEAAS